MSTPLKPAKFLLSPISPLVYSCIKNPINKSCNVNRFRHRNVARKLNFSHSPSRLIPKTENTTKKFKNYLNKPENNNLQVPFLLNTPSKLELFQHGVGTKNKFKILGKGSFGTVVRGKHKEADVALKIIKLNKNSCENFGEKNMINFSHENIVKIFDVMVNDSFNYGVVVMEYINGAEQLLNLLNDKSNILNQNIIVGFALDICRGLQYCHENGILHLDLKPNNVLVCANNMCKLCDFGSSVRVETADQQILQGTVPYSAPEMLLGQMPTNKSDIYSLGILLWQMKHRRQPYEEFENPEIIIYKVVKYGLRPNFAETDDEYSKIYVQCWAADPEERLQLLEVVDKLNTLR